MQRKTALVVIDVQKLRLVLVSGFGFEVVF